MSADINGLGLRSGPPLLGIGHVFPVSRGLRGLMPISVLHWTVQVQVASLVGAADVPGESGTLRPKCQILAPFFQVTRISNQ